MVKPLVLLALIVLCCAEPNPELVEDLVNFYDVIPIKELTALAEKYYETDVEFRGAVDYILGPDFRILIDDFITNPDVLQLLTKIVTSVQREVYPVMPSFIEEITVIRQKRELYTGKRSLKKFLEEAGRMIPYDTIYDLIIYKLATRPSFAKFYQVISGEETRDQVIMICSDGSFQRIYTELQRMDVPILRYIERVFGLFNWSLPYDIFNYDIYKN